MIYKTGYVTKYKRRINNLSKMKNF